MVVLPCFVALVVLAVVVAAGAVAGVAVVGEAYHAAAVAADIAVVVVEVAVAMATAAARAFLCWVDVWCTEERELPYAVGTHQPVHHAVVGSL